MHWNEGSEEFQKEGRNIHPCSFPPLVPFFRSSLFSALPSSLLSLPDSLSHNSFSPSRRLLVVLLQSRQSVSLSLPFSLSLSLCLCVCMCVSTVVHLLRCCGFRCFRLRRFPLFLLLVCLGLVFRLLSDLRRVLRLPSRRVLLWLLLPFFFFWCR